ncbi:MAG: hypothetical protein II206_04635, partial [Bacteroidaceae bacterium]|nr:hypothetical protein [Bacteroidaceae bacterium]
MYRLRLKESDRLAAITATLNALGAEVEEYSDHLIIHGRQQLAGGVTVDCCNDHRITGDEFVPCSISSFDERTRAAIKIEDGCNRFCS